MLLVNKTMSRERGIFIPVQSGISRISCCAVLLLLDRLELFGCDGEGGWKCFELFSPHLWEPGPGQCWLAGLSLPGGAALRSCCWRPQAQELLEPFEFSDQKAGLGRISRKPVNGLGEVSLKICSAEFFYPGLCCLCCCDRLKLTFFLYLL